MLLVWGKFSLLLFLVYIFGSKIAKSSDIIAEKRGGEEHLWELCLSRW